MFELEDCIVQEPEESLLNNEGYQKVKRRYPSSFSASYSFGHKIGNCILFASLLAGCVGNNPKNSQGRSQRELNIPTLSSFSPDIPYCSVQQITDEDLIGYALELNGVDEPFYPGAVTTAEASKYLELLNLDIESEEEFILPEGIALTEEEMEPILKRLEMEALLREYGALPADFILNNETLARKIVEQKFIGQYNCAPSEAQVLEFMDALNVLDGMSSVEDNMQSSKNWSEYVLMHLEELYSAGVFASHSQLVQMGIDPNNIASPESLTNMGGSIMMLVGVGQFTPAFVADEAVLVLGYTVIAGGVYAIVALDDSGVVEDIIYQINKRKQKAAERKAKEKQGKHSDRSHYPFHRIAKAIINEVKMRIELGIGVVSCFAFVVSEGVTRTVHVSIVPGQNMPPFIIVTDTNDLTGFVSYVTAYVARDKALLGMNPAEIAVATTRLLSDPSALTELSKCLLPEQK